MSDPYAETDEWPTPPLPAHTATDSPERVENGSTVTGDAQGAREARYAEAIDVEWWKIRDVAIAGRRTPAWGSWNAARALARAVMAVADAEQAELRAEVERLTRERGEGR